MKIRNFTDISTEKIREIVKFVKPRGVANFTLEICNSKKAFRGVAYTGINKIKVEVGDESKFPNIFKMQGFNLLLLNRDEALVYIIAHELRHLKQAKYIVFNSKNYKITTKLRMVWGSRGVYSERDANAYAIRKVREYRKKQNNNFFNT